MDGRVSCQMHACMLRPPGVTGKERTELNPRPEHGPALGALDGLQVAGLPLRQVIDILPYQLQESACARGCVRQKSARGRGGSGTTMERESIRWRGTLTRPQVVVPSLQKTPRNSKVAGGTSVLRVAVLRRCARGGAETVVRVSTSRRRGEAPCALLRRGLMTSAPVMRGRSEAGSFMSLYGAKTSIATDAMSTSTVALLCRQVTYVPKPDATKVMSWKGGSRIQAFAAAEFRSCSRYDTARCVRARLLRGGAPRNSPLRKQLIVNPLRARPRLDASETIMQPPIHS